MQFEVASIDSVLAPKIFIKIFKTMEDLNSIKWSLQLSSKLENLSPRQEVVQKAYLQKHHFLAANLTSSTVLLQVSSVV